MKLITYRTRITGLIGDPISSSVSPAMHNAAFTELGLDYLYLPLRVVPSDLAAAVDGLHALNFRGFNVTMPHKVTVIPLLDGLEPAAADIGAVNTVVNNDGELRGYNTDGEGFLRSLREEGVEPAGKKVLVLGAGGASRAVSYTLVRHDASVTILNRDAEKAAMLADSISDEIGRGIQHDELNLDNLDASLATADILVNTTSLGMNPDTEASPVPADLLRPDLVVCDIVYNPPLTRLLRDALDAGAKTVDGVGMMVWQGALAFELWTGQTPPVDLMREVVVRELEKR